MKKLMTLIFLVALNLTAQAADFTCLKVNDKTGFAYELKKQVEDDKSVEFTFLTRFGSCESGELVAEAIKRKSGKVRVYDDALHIPFITKALSTVSIEEFGSETEYIVKLTKKDLLKRKQRGILEFISSSTNESINSFLALRPRRIKME
ncbi:hypothetical protein [Bacteriovorax sp. DB6_IX]|uniref:hypothetical protein n=1 Tax=Bacteriovorax sp. DB6_IX TaxID=1353530 RepID=UPI000554E6A7|nr:hypothetical protein [Bacteriovorax sp. DB6_IX]